MKMKRCLAFLMVLLIGLLSGGCGRQPPKPSSVVSKITAPSSAVASSSSAAQKIPGTAGWPTTEWSESSPEQQGMSTAKLLKVEGRIRDNYPNLYSLLVVRHGFLVYEKYYGGMNRDSANPVYSVTKSITSALTGIAIQKKLIQGVSQRVADLLPEYFANVDNQKKTRITVENILTMMGGLRSIDSGYAAYFQSSDWVQAAIDQPLTNQPGTKFQYNTGLPQFLSAAISKTSGMDMRKFAEENLFSKIGMKVGDWARDSKGCCGGGFGLSLTPRDMAKFGYLYLHNGKWSGEQIIPKDWIQTSTHKHVAVDKNNDYGYLFWIQEAFRSKDGKSRLVYYASGYGGQIIMMIPDLDMVTVVTASAAGKSKDGEDTLGLISEYVVPAVVR